MDLKLKHKCFLSKLVLFILYYRYIYISSICLVLFEMAETSEVYTERVLQQRICRKKSKVQYQQLVESESNCHTDSTSDSIGAIHLNLSDNKTTAVMVNQQGFEDDVGNHYFADEDDTKGFSFSGEADFQDHYSPDKVDNPDIDDSVLFSHDGMPLLHQQTTISVGEAVKLIMKFCVNSNSDKFKVVSLMGLIKSILPTPNQFPTPFHQILKIFGQNPWSMTKFYCNNCLTLTTLKWRQQYCTNSNCALVGLKLSKRRLKEIVIMNVREKLQSIVRQNISLFTGYEEFFPAFDIPSSNRYQSITKKLHIQLRWTYMSMVHRW